MGLWAFFRLDGDPSRLSGEAVVLAATGESSSCPSHLSDATVEDATLHLSLKDEPAITPPPNMSVVDFGDTQVSLGPAGEITSEDYGG